MAEAVCRHSRIYPPGVAASTRRVALSFLIALPLAVRPSEAQVERPARGQPRRPPPVQTDTQAAEAPSRLEWRMPPMPTAMPMLAPLMRLRPGVRPFLPDPGGPLDSLPLAAPRELVHLSDGDTLRLTARRVRRTLRGRTFVMYGFNGQIPGPLIQVPRAAEITVVVTNRIDLPTTVHWHGVRLDNRFDGVPGVTQDPIEPGASFVYQVRFPDAGLYWYHPHVREDIEQDLGLYGNVWVRSEDPDYFSPVNREEVLMLDDLLLDQDGPFPYGAEGATHTLMGRYGNVLLVNGDPSYRLHVRRGDVVRFYLTDVSNTRTFNLRLGDVPLKVVAADIGKFEREQWVRSVPIGPAQRYVVEARFERPGEVALTNQIQAINHFFGRYEPRIDTLGIVTVSEDSTAEDHADTFGKLRESPAVIAEIDRYRAEFGRPVDHELELTTRVGDLPRTIVQIMSMDTLYYPPVEWNDVMPVMNFLSAGNDLAWIMRDVASGRENMDIHWRFRRGEVVKIRIHNSTRAFHPMQHPMHFHGQRLLVVTRDGVPSTNLAWKDTVIIPAGSTVDLLLDASNPGRWMAHCHIAEHLAAGMKMVFSVDDGASDASGSGQAQTRRNSS